MNLKVGMKVSGVVTGIQPYGVFVDIGEHQQGLIHISECHSGYVADIYRLFKVGQPVNALIIDIDEYSGKISLSTRTTAVNYSVLLHARGFKPRKIHYWTNYQLSLGFKPIARSKKQWLSDARICFE